MDFDLDNLLFAVLPYVAAVTCLVLLAARRYRVPPFGPPRPTGAGSHAYGERLLFGYGILVILAGHVLAFLIPDQLLEWNNHPVRLYVLEVSALVFALMTVVGLVLTVGRCLTSAEARQGTRLADWILYALVLVQLASGIYVALFYAWGSSWYATSVVPYLRSVFRLDPDLTYISGMPPEVKLHVVNAYVLLAVLPFTRFVRPLVARPLEDEEERGRSYLTTIVLLVGLTFSLLALVPRLAGTHLPGNDQGYEPAQPIAFSHRQHAGDLQISCIYCHSQADKSRHAGIPAASVCMNCHYYVTAPIGDVRAEAALAKQQNRDPRLVVSAKLQKLYAALALDDNLKPDPAKRPRPIRWVKVHNLPAFVRFDHRAHMNARVDCRGCHGRVPERRSQHLRNGSAGVDCKCCHGPVETMERVRQVESLSMGWCVNCHRQANQTEFAGKPVRASNDCTACHY
jgi:nitrate reductase gamma subunit